MKLPVRMYSALGPLPVECLETLPSPKPDTTTMGMASCLTRTIQISDEAKSESGRLHTLCHEWIHFGLFDSGVANGLTEEQTEAVCDAIGTLIAGAALNGYVVFRSK